MAELLRHRPFRYYFLGRGCARVAIQIATVALGWQVYHLTDSAFALGMIGLTQFLPTALLVFFAGHVADRHDRRRVVQICQVAQGLTAALLAWATFGGWVTVPALFAAVAVLGATMAFDSPASAAMLPAVAPKGLLQRATALSTGVMQFAVIGGPALGGFAYAVTPGLPYLLMAALWLVASLLTGLIEIDRSVAPPVAAEPGAIFAGLRFVRSDPAILGTISLDLVAVLLGGATALMPIYARDILHAGPWGLGALRAAPAVGALMMTLVLARRSITRRVGMRMFQAVIVFGLATIAFALSTSLALSLLALAVMGAADTVSVVIRVSLVLLRTPDDLRGRVGAVNFLFINASNQLGEFESGVLAALVGAVPAALLGGIGTVGVALLWMGLFPALRRMERLE